MKLCKVTTPLSHFLVFYCLGIFAVPSVTTIQSDSEFTNDYGYKNGNENRVRNAGALSMRMGKVALGETRGLTEVGEECAQIISVSSSAPGLMPCLMKVIESNRIESSQGVQWMPDEDGDDNIIDFSVYEVVENGGERLSLATFDANTGEESNEHDTDKAPRDGPGSDSSTETGTDTDFSSPDPPRDDGSRLFNGGIIWGIIGTTLFSISLVYFACIYRDTLFSKLPFFAPNFALPSIPFFSEWSKYTPIPSFSPSTSTASKQRRRTRRSRVFFPRSSSASHFRPHPSTLHDWLASDSLRLDDTYEAGLLADMSSSSLDDDDIYNFDLESGASKNKKNKGKWKRKDLGDVIDLGADEDYMIGAPQRSANMTKDALGVSKWKRFIPAKLSGTLSSIQGVQKKKSKSRTHRRSSGASGSSSSTIIFDALVDNNDDATEDVFGDGYNAGSSYNFYGAGIETNESIPLKPSPRQYGYVHGLGHQNGATSVNSGRERGYGSAS